MIMAFYRFLFLRISRSDLNWSFFFYVVLKSLASTFNKRYKFLFLKSANWKL